ncbi:YveK family protein [Levilactobacillus spicheri]|uniref:Capsular polysaccharide biosynthesis protein CpsC n=1 Tax=Levilactobacillus spicheri TaxID=216463 RepID=A0A0F3RNW6_9LACO|nr:Wzz/FepE/Etk N-terminal domain-containing protein [Levilactobacillus spicheri]KJW11646.1 chain-length determining protein [Levilactobacillus spicheri]
MDSEQTISVMQILGILRKRLRLIVITTLVVTLATAFVTFFVMTPKYEATTELLVNRKLSADMQGAALQQTQADVQMISTYKDIITSPTVLQKVGKMVNNYPGYPGSTAALKSAISISNQANSQVFSVTVKSADARTSAAIANTTAKVFKKQVVKMMSVHNVSIVSKATPNFSAVSPRKGLNIVAGLIVGIILGIGLAFIRELSDKTVTDETFLTEELGLTGLGLISEIDEKEIVKQQQAKRHAKRDVLITGSNGMIESREQHRRV